MTKAGRDLIDNPHCAFNEIVPHYLSMMDQARLRRRGSEICGHLHDYLDMLSLAASDWISIDELTVE